MSSWGKIIWTFQAKGEQLTMASVLSDCLGLPSRSSVLLFAIILVSLSVGTGSLSVGTGKGV